MGTFRFTLLLYITFFLCTLAFANTLHTSNSEPPIYEEATLGGGCFWCTEALFQRIPGVTDVESGYSGGMLPNPSYLDVKSGLSGYAEVVRIRFNPKIVNYEQILNAFFYSHDPTSLNRQGVDVGHQYRSVIFYHSEEQKKIAEKVIKQFELSCHFQGAIVTEVSPLRNYYPAEDYHQDYYENFKNDQYCTVDTADIGYKIDKFFREYNESYKQTVQVPTPHEEKETVNTKPHLPTDIKVIKSHVPYHPWHNITYGGAAPEVVVAYIEIQKGSRAKYEIDKMSGLLGLDRVLHPSFPYPLNYGFIPQTLYGDGDAMDILVLSSIDLDPNTLVQARIVGMLTMVDNNEKDDKLLSVVHKDHSLNHIQDVKDLPTDLISQLTVYFENYKKHENITVEIKSVENKFVAHSAIKAAVQLYRDFYVFSQ